MQIAHLGTAEQKTEKELARNNMGLLSCLDCISCCRNIRVLMIGLDGAGKTTILHKITTGELSSATIPTIGYNKEVIKHKNVVFEIWDAGGQASIRPIWRIHLLSSQAVIFVVDSNDRDRIDEAHNELFQVLNDENLGGADLLVLANKQV